MEDKKSKKELIIQILWFLFGIAAIVFHILFIINFCIVDEDGNGMIGRVIGLLAVAVMALMALIWWITKKNLKLQELRTILFVILSVLVIASILGVGFWTALTVSVHAHQGLYSSCLYLICALIWYVLLCIMRKQYLNKNMKNKNE